MLSLNNQHAARRSLIMASQLLHIMKFFESIRHSVIRFIGVEDKEVKKSR